jgi:vancomycin resistance protein YoaR
MLNGGRVDNARLRGTVPFVRRLPAGRLRVVTLLAMGAMALFVLVGAAWAVEQLVYSGEVLPGVEVDGAAVAGKSPRDAADAITRLATDLERTPLPIRAGDHAFTLEPSAIGFRVDTAQTSQGATRAGRQGNVFARAVGTVARRVRADHVPLVVEYDTHRLDDVLAAWSVKVDSGIVEGGLRFVGTEVVVVEPHAGTGIQRVEAHHRIAEALARNDRSEQVRLPVGEVHPRVGRRQVDAAAARARRLLSEGFEIRAGVARAVLGPEALAPMLGTRVTAKGLDLTIDTTKLRAAVGPSVAAFETPAVDATFAVNSDNTVSVVPSRDGRTVDFAAAAHDILAGRRVVVAGARKVRPDHDTAWARKLGITRQVSAFTTYHQAGQPRVHNIHLAADTLNNTIVEPGQLFSLNERLGPRTPDKGYVKAPILVNDGFGEDFGGGVSQLTTTVYNAVFYGGFADVEHSAHRFYISRYPMGREATINYPSIDLKFRNDTTHGVLIRTYYSDTAITVAFYGDNEGRSVREENRRILHTEPLTDALLKCPVKNPADDPANDCATLPARQRKVVQTGEVGYDVEFERVIEQPGQPARRQHYQVHYPMLPNKVLVGTVAPTTTTTAKDAKKPKPRSTSTTTPRRP